MDSRRYILVLALLISQLAAAQQQQPQRSIQPIDRQVNADVLASPQEMLPEVVTHTQPVPADILEPPQLATPDPTRSKSDTANQTVSRWALAPMANPKNRGFSATSPPALSQLPPPASAWTLGLASNSTNHGLSTTSPPALGQLPRPASAWTLGPSLKAMEQNASASAATQAAPTAVSGWMRPKGVPDKTSLALVPGPALDRMGSGTFDTAFRPDLSETRLFQKDDSRPGLDDSAAVGAETGLAATEATNGAILYGKHFEPTRAFLGLESPFTSPMSAARQERQLFPNRYASLHSHAATARESELPSQLRRRPEVRRALRMASSRGQHDEKGSYCKLRPQCATQAAKNKSSSHISRRSQSSMRLRLESALGN